MFSKNKKFLIAGIVVVLVAGVAVLYLEKPWQETSDDLKSYIHPGFKVSFEYPALWDPDLEGGAFQGIPMRFKGVDGYFGVDAVAANTDVQIEEVIKVLVFENPNKKNPYGSSPAVNQTVINGMDASFILPSDDQPAEANQEALLLVKYPEQLEVGKDKFYFFMLYGDAAHIEKIGNTVKFISANESSP